MVNLFFKQSIYLVLLYVSSVVMLSACTKEKSDNLPENKGLLTAYKTEVSVMQIVALEAVNINLTQTEYTATIGGVTVKVGADKDINALGFLMPSLPEGKHDLKITIDGTEYINSFTIKPNPQIAEPVNFINTSIERLTLTDLELDNIDLQMRNMQGNEFSKDNIQILKSYTHYVNEMIAKLSKEEQEQLAVFIASNPELFSITEDPTQYIDSLSFQKREESPEEILDRTIERARVNKNKLVLIAGAGLASAYFGQPWLAAACGLALTYKLYEYNAYNIAGLDKALVRFGEILADEISAKKKESMYSFQNGKSYLIRVKSSYRNPNKEDVSTNAVLIKDMILLLDEVGKIWIKVNTVTSKFGYDLKGTSFHIKNIGTRQSKTLQVDPKLLFITNISNSKVSGTVNITDQGLEVVFTTKENAPQEFTFDIMYKSKAGEAKLQFEATLEMSKLYGWYAGKYTLAKDKDHNGYAPQIGQQGDIYFYVYSTTAGKPDVIIYAPIIVNAFIENVYLENAGYQSILPNTVGGPKKVILSSQTEISFQPGYAKIDEGKSIIGYEYNGAWGFEGSLDNRFSYVLEYNVPYVGTVAPTTLSQAELNIIFAKKL